MSFSNIKGSCIFGKAFFLFLGQLNRQLTLNCLQVIWGYCRWLLAWASSHWLSGMNAHHSNYVNVWLFAVKVQRQPFVVLIVYIHTSQWEYTIYGTALLVSHNPFVRQPVSNRSRLWVCVHLYNVCVLYPALTIVVSLISGLPPDPSRLSLYCYIWSNGSLITKANRNLWKAFCLSWWQRMSVFAGLKCI